MTEDRTHCHNSAIDDDRLVTDSLHNARVAVAQRFPAAAARIMAGEWDNGPWITKALAGETAE